MTRRRFWSFGLLFLFASGGLIQNALPDPVQIYRRIIFTSDERAGDMRWIEVWETQNRALGDRQWVMIDVQGTLSGLDSTCHHAVAIGAGAPIYLVDNELVPVSSAGALFEQVENRRLIDQSLLYISNLEDFPTTGTDVTEGILSERRIFENQDATNLFLIRPPATSSGTLWTAVDGQYVTRYEFVAHGSAGDVSHVYRLRPGGSVQPPGDVDMLCFEGGFPLPAQTSALATGNLTHNSFVSDLSVDSLWLFYDEMLIPTWEPLGNDSFGGRLYSRTLEDGSVCRMGLQFQQNPAGGTVMTARVVPAVVSEAAFSNITDEFETPSIIQTAANFSFTVVGDVRTALDEILPDLAADGWKVRDVLTDIRDTSAFVTLAKDGGETHVIIDLASDGQTSIVRVQQRDPVCGPTFELN